MKFFPELGFCFGGAAVSMDVETTVTLPLPPPPSVPNINPNDRAKRPPCRSSRSRLMKVHSSTVQWKPELSAIAEDRVVSDGRKKEELFAGQPPAKRASKYGTDYRKSCHRMVIPAFSPTPFVF